MILLSVTFLYFGLTFKSERKLTYSESGNVDYKVYLKSNDDYNTPFLEKNRKYIASLIDHIDVDYNYQFKTSENMDYICKYYIIASALVKDNNEENKLIFEKEKYLLDTQIKEFSNQKDVNLTETVSLNYDEYNKLIEKFNSKYSLSGNNNTLQLTLFVELTGKNKAFKLPITDNSKLELNIPLTRSTVAVDLDYKEIDEKGEKVEVSTNKLINIICFILSIVLFMLALSRIILIIKKYMEMKSKETYYEKVKSEIMTNYSKLISKIYDFKNGSSDNFIDVDNFIDLVNVRDCLEKPILFLEGKNKKTSWFLVTDNSVIYRFILTDKKVNN